MLFTTRLICIVLFITTHNLFSQDIFEAARKGDTVRTLELITRHKDTIHSRNSEGFTPLILAAYYGHLPLAKLLLEHKANVHTDSPEGPAILAACYKRDIELTRLLILYGANVNACNGQGMTALMYAALANSPALVKLLLMYGAKKDRAEKSGKTALDYADLHSSKELTALLSGE